MSIRTLIAICFVLPACISNVYADDYYAGGTFLVLDYSESGFEDASLNALGGRIGRQFNENFSGEIRAGFGVGDDSVNVFGTDVDVELNHFFGGYLRGGIPVGPSLYPYAIAGYTRGEAEASVSGVGSVTESESDVSYGIGIDIQLSENLDLNIEHMNYLDKDDTEIDGFSAGFAWRF